MHRYLRTLIFVQTFSAFYFEVEANPDNENANKNWPYNLRVEFPYKTYSPIDIDEKNLKTVKFKNPISYFEPINEEVILVNTGKSVEFFSTAKKPSSQAKGGIYGNHTYRFGKTRLYWSKNADERCASAINGKGTSLEVALFYYKDCYETLENSKKFRDGIITVRIQIFVVSSAAPNPKFDLFKAGLKKIPYPGNRTTLRFFEASAFFTPSPLTQQYFGYPGSYVTDSGEQIECSTDIVLHTRTLNISKKQFEVFGTLKNSKGQRIINRMALQKTNGRPMAVMKGMFPSPGTNEILNKQKLL